LRGLVLMPEQETGPDVVDVERPSMARMYDFLLGGHHHFAGDREFGRRLLAAEPNARLIVAENRAFLNRAIRFLTAAGVRQFIDLGSGIPARENVHELARRADAGARVVYIDSDPVVAAQSRHLLDGDQHALAIQADLRDPDAVLGHQQVMDLIDFSEPVGLLMINVLAFVPDSDDPAGAVCTFADHLAPGSYLAITHSTADALPDTTASLAELYAGVSVQAHARTRGEILAYFQEFDLVEPGLVYMQLWRPDGDPPEHPELAWFYAGVGRKASPG
jgi:hypothetical protein